MTVAETDISKKAFDENGYSGPVPFLTAGECVLLQNYVRGGELAKPMAWSKGLAARDRLIYGFATRPNLLKWLALLLGPDVYLWGAQVITKKPGEAHAWHTDIETARPIGKFVSVWAGFENTSAKSALQYISRSHLIGKSLQQVGYEKQVARPDRTAAKALALAKESRPDANFVEVDVTDGDAILFDGRIWHGSLNTDERPRRALLLQYAAARERIRIPDLDKTMNWPFAFKDQMPPAINVLGRPRSNRNMVGPPRSPSRLDQPFVSAIAPVPDGKPWTPHHLLKGKAPSVENLSAHFSILQPGHSPHAPHAHIEEEILLLIEGEGEIILPSSKDDTAPAIHRLKPGDFAYYPAYRWHTIRNASTAPMVYIMFKWCGAPLGLKQHAQSGIFLDRHVPDRTGKPNQRQLVFEGGTHFLAKLHAHRSLVLPGGGYAAHADTYDVLITLLQGTIETMGREVEAPAFLYHPAGTPHGLRAVGSSPARYLVVEMHGAKRERNAFRSQMKSVLGTQMVIRDDRHWRTWRVGSRA